MPKLLYKDMSKLYKVQYEIDDDPSDQTVHHIHSKYYHALNFQTALAMFEETCDRSLQSYHIKPVAVYISTESTPGHRHWEQVNISN